MKLATLKDGSRDGQLVVVSRDLRTAQYATAVASRMQQVLDDWNFYAPQLQDLYQSLNQARATHAFPFEPARCMAPLPRAYGRWRGHAWLAPVQRLAAARSGALPARCLTEPMLMPMPTDAFFGPRDELHLHLGLAGPDLEAGLAVVTDALPAGASRERCLQAIRLIMLSADLSLRHLIDDARDDAQTPAFGLASLAQAYVGASFSPVAVTPDEVDLGWQAGRLNGQISVAWQGDEIGRINTHEDMQFDFGRLLTHLTRTRALPGGGQILVAGPPGQDTEPAEHASLALMRAHEQATSGSATTPLLSDGDTFRVDWVNAAGQSVFGAIEHSLQIPEAPVAAPPPAPAKPVRTRRKTTRTGEAA